MAPPYIADEGTEHTYPADDFTQWWQSVWPVNLAQLTQIADANPHVSAIAPSALPGRVGVTGGGSAGAPTGMAA